MKKRTVNQCGESRTQWILLPLMAKALAIKPMARPLIDKLYNKNKEFYSGLAKQAKCAVSHYLSENDIETEVYIHKAIGLIMAASEEDWDGKKELEAKIIEILRKAYKAEWNYTKNNQKIIFLDYWNRIIERYDSENELMSSFTVLLYFGKLNGNELPTEFAQYYSMAVKKVESYEKSPKEVLKEVKDSVDWQRFIMRWIEKVYFPKGWPATLAKLRDTEAFTEMDDVVKINTLLRFDGAPYSAIEHTRFTKNDLAEIMAVFAANRDTNSLPDEETILEALDFYVYSMIMRSYAREYSKAKKYFFDHSAEIEDNEDIKKVKTELYKANNRIFALEKLNADKQEALNRIQLDYDRQQKRIHDLELEMSDAKEEIAILTDIAKQPEPEVKEKSDIDISSYRVLVVGGSDKWQQTIKSQYPDFTYVSYDSTNFDVHLLDKADIVAFNWLYGSHKVFYRLISAVKKKGKKIAYIGKNNERYFKEIITNVL